MACSTYRSVERQTELFNAEIEKWKKQGMSQQQAEEKAATVVMIPGCSEHNTGLAVDVGSITNQRVEEDLRRSPNLHGCNNMQRSMVLFCATKRQTSNYWCYL